MAHSLESPIRLHWLDPHNPLQGFPPVHTAMREPNGLLAIGGDLSPGRLLRAYAQGIFPWYNPNEPILWWSPAPRAIFEPDGVHVSHSLARALRRADYAVTLDTDFAGVLEGCAGPRGSRTGVQHGTWLGTDMRSAYLRLHRLGYAHSIEVWRAGSLIGGVYGVALGRVFFGESMFSHADNGSKIALVWLSRQLAAWGFDMIDCQVGSSHLRSMGAVEIPRETFIQRLNRATHGRAPQRWRPTLDLPCSAAHMPAP